MFVKKLLDRPLALRRSFFECNLLRQLTGAEIEGLNLRQRSLEITQLCDETLVRGFRLDGVI